MERLPVLAIKIAACDQLLTPTSSLPNSLFSTLEYQQVRAAFDAAGAMFAQIHTSGHACRNDLEAFAHHLAPRHLVPIHSFTWGQHLQGFEKVMRLRDGEVFTIP